MKKQYEKLLILCLINLFIAPACKINREELQKKYASAAKYYAQKEIDKSQKIYEEILKEERSSHALMMLGKLHYFKGRYIPSEKYFSEVLDSDKCNLGAMYWLGKIEIQTREKRGDALKKLETVLEKNVSVAEAAYLKGTIFESEGKTQQALQAYNQVIHEEEKIALAYMRIARIYERGNSKLMSEKYYSRAEILAESNPELLKVLKKGKRSKND